MIKKRNSLSNDEIKDIRKQIYENVEALRLIKLKKIANKKQHIAFNDIKDSLNKLHDHILNIETENYDDGTYNLEDLEELYKYSVYYIPTAVAQAFDCSYVKYVINGDKISSIGQHFNKIICNLHKLINDYKQKGEWEVQLSIQVIFSSIIDKNKTDIMHTKSDNVKILKRYNTSDIIEKLYNTLINRSQEGLENKMNGSNYVFDNVYLLDINLNKISISRCRKNGMQIKKCTINPHNDKDNMCFMYALTVANCYINISNDPQRISKLISYIKYYD